MNYELPGNYAEKPWDCIKEIIRSYEVHKGIKPRGVALSQNAFETLINSQPRLWNSKIRPPEPPPVEWTTLEIDGVPISFFRHESEVKVIE